MPAATMTAARPSPAPAPPFSGSYDPADVVFLLKPVDLDATPVADKERLIQSGRRHYSEMVSREAAPGPAYEGIYRTALAAGAARMGREVAALAKALAATLGPQVTLASLVRAGVPLGVLLTRALRALAGPGADVAHYGISIIRDRGLDEAALAHALHGRDPAGLVFVDGWTGKGAITGELERSLADRPDVRPRLVVLADPCGRAWLSASGDDWLIPSGILGATVSGLVSRSVLNDSVVGPGDFHACVPYPHLAPHDQSRAFVEAVWPHVLAALPEAVPATWTDADRERQSGAARAVVAGIAGELGIANPNRVKPGIAEATRAVLRRVPERVFVSDPGDPDLAALVHLAVGAGVPVEARGAALAPYRAVTVIRKVA